MHLTTRVYGIYFVHCSYYTTTISTANVHMHMLMHIDMYMHMHCMIVCTLCGVFLSLVSFFWSSFFLSVMYIPVHWLKCFQLYIHVP